MAERTSPAPFPADWPLVGREAELAGIAAARADRHCPGVVVTAAPGAGKSRLAREAQAAADRDGALTAWVQATRSAAAVPLGAVAGLIPDELRTDHPLELMRRCEAALRERAGGREVVLAVDDAQLLDAVSAALVLHLAATGTAFIIATVREGEPSPDAITSLWKDVDARRLELGRLSDDAIAQLVETALAAPVEQFGLSRVITHSQGNPMYARELVLSALADNILSLEDGLWRVARRRTRISHTLIELVQDRMADLGGGEHELLELLALGEPLRLADVDALSSMDALTRAEALGMVSADGLDHGGEVRLAHPIYGDALRADMPVLRAGQLRLQIAERLQQRSPLSPDDALRVARLLLDAGADLPSALLVGAARAANLAGDPDLGADLAALAAADGAGLPALLLLARAHTVRKRYDDAEATLAGAEALVAPDAAGLDYLEQRVHVLFWGLNRVEEVRELLERAGGWSDDAGWAMRIDALQLRFGGELPAAVPALQGVLADPSVGDDVRRMAERRLAIALFYVGRTREASALATRVLPSIPLRGYSDALALGAWRLIESETGDDWPALDLRMARTLRDGVRAHDDEAAGHGALGLAYTAYQRGGYRDAGRWLAEAEVHFGLEDTFGNLLHSLALRVGVDLFRGEPEAALASYERLQATLAGRQPLFSQRSLLARADGWALRAGGHLETARQSFLGAAQALADMPPYSAQLLYEALRAGAPAAPLAEGLAALAAVCDARLTAAYGAHASGLAARDGGALMAAADEFAAIGADRYAMEAAVDAADAFVAEAREDSARRAAARARELHAEGHGAPFPRIDGLDSVAIALTARESQMVELATKGLTNAEIAARLVLSVRTVETHIYRAMQKLGVNDRRDL
jgi:DNA-binding NarL/FixJ family response regulator